MAAVCCIGLGSIAVMQVDEPELKMSSNSQQCDSLCGQNKSKPTTSQHDARNGQTNQGSVLYADDNAVPGRKNPGTASSCQEYANHQSVDRNSEQYEI